MNTISDAMTMCLGSVSFAFFLILLMTGIAHAVRVSIGSSDDDT